MDFAACRGVVLRMGTGDPNEGFSLNPGISFPEDSPIIMSRLDVRETTVNLPVVTLNGVRILYVFGQAWGDVGVGGMALMGKSGAAIGKVFNWYTTHSVSNGNPRPIGVSLGQGGNFSFYVTGLSVGDPDVEYRIIPFSITGKLIKVG